MKKPFLFLAVLLTILALGACEKSCPMPNTDPNIKGCGDFVVARIIAEDQIATVGINRDKIGLSTDFQVFPNAANLPFATIEIEQNCDIQAVWYGVCNDVFQTPSCQSVHWTFKSGKLSFKVSEVPTGSHCSDFYLATVILENATFQKEGSTETQTFDKIEFINVQVGWCAG